MQNMNMSTAQNESFAVFSYKESLLENFRYLAVTQPLNYSRRRRSKRLALLMILVVWILALAITCPPILGWYVQQKTTLTDLPKLSKSSLLSVPGMSQDDVI